MITPPQPSKIKTALLALAIIVLGGGLIVLSARWYTHRQAPEPVVNDNREQPKLVPSINGTLVEEYLATRRPLAIVIENHPEARPQSGLAEADIVYEAIAEGGITRYLALFQSKDPGTIGPVRSDRTFFNVIANQWRAALVHVGGSRDALKELRANIYRHIVDADQYFYGTYFTRTIDRPAPHNVYTSTKALYTMLADRNIPDWNTQTLFGFANAPITQTEPAITSITIPFSTASYSVQYQYDPVSTRYQRSIGGKPAIDRNDNRPIQPVNVLVMFVETAAVVDDPTGTYNIIFERGGIATLYTAGSATTGSWFYKNGTLQYEDSEGNPMTLQPGQTWIELVPETLSITAQ